LGLTSGSLDGLGNGNATVGSAIKQTVTVSAGTQLSFDWNFLTNEGTPTSFNDFGFVSIVSNTLDTLANTNSSFGFSPTIFNEETGFDTFSYTFQTAGTFTLGIGVVDVGDTVVDSGLLVDNLSFTGNSFPIGGSQKVTLSPGDTVTNIDFGNQKIPPQTLFGTSGNDVFTITDSPVIVFALAGNDQVDGSGSAGGNRFYGGKGDDTLIGNSYDQLFGEAGDNRLDVSNGAGNNLLDGGKGDDELLANLNDQLFGGKGDDILIAGFNDQLSGGDGDDLLFGGYGGSTMTGGNGDEQFWIVNGFVPSAAHTITDFEVEIDRIGIRGLGITFQQLDLIQDGNDTRISVFNTDLAILSGIQASALNSSDFILA
jgi:Ca2+-binding RTX toxin-like protein